MTLPFGCWEGGDSLFNAVDLEADEDELEDIAIEEMKYEFHANGKVKHDSKTLLSGETLLIGVGSASVKFLELYTELPEIVTAELKFVGSDSENNKCAYKKNKCLIYKVKDILLCLCSPVIKNGNYKSWTRELFKYVKCKNVVILSQSSKLHLGNYRALENDSDVLRCLQTTKYKEQYSSNVTTTEKGVLIGELPAALFTYCENEDIPAILYTNFLDSSYIDVFTLNCFKVVLENSLLRGFVTKVSDNILKKRLKNFDGIPVAENYVYI